MYGVDWAFFPYIAGGNTAVAAMAASFSNILTLDYYGTPATELPVMQYVKTGADVDLYYAIGHGSGPLDAVFYPMYHTKAITADTESYEVTSLTGYFLTGKMHGGVFGLVGSTAYENLLDKNGYTNNQKNAGAGLVATNMGDLYMVAILIVGNIIIAGKKFQIEKRLQFKEKYNK